MVIQEDNEDNDEQENKKALEKRKKLSRWISDKTTLDSNWIKFPKDENGYYYYIDEKQCQISRVLIENADKWVDEKNKEIKREQTASRESVKKASEILSRDGQGEFFNEIQPIFYDKSSMFWLWNEEKKCWEISDEVDLLNILKSSNPSINIIDSTERTEIINTLKQEGRKNHPKTIKNTWIQFKEEIIDISTGERFPATSKYFVTNPIPYRINGDSSTPTMDKIFEEWVGKDHIKTLYEIIAYCCLCDYPINRLFCFVGAGMNGKSKFLELLRRFIGTPNVCSTELDLLLTSRFEVTKLHKKLVCMMGETNFNEMKNTSIIKRLTGGDLIGFEYKNKNPFEDKNYAKIIIATNNLPETTDKTIGFYRRWMIIDFPNNFSEAKDILKDIPEQEYHNLATKCVLLLIDLLRERKFTNEGSVEERMKKFEDRSNPLGKFIKENCSLENLNDFITCSQFEKRFNDWAKQHKYREFTMMAITEHFKKNGIRCGKGYIDWYDNGSIYPRKVQARGYFGIKIK